MSSYISLNSPWIYQTSGQTKGLVLWGSRATYGAGGYVQEMDINRDLSLVKVADLKQNLWIDRQTRAVILEFTVYNPNIDLFAFTSLMAEFSETAGVVHTENIQVVRAHTMGALSAFLILCKAILAIYMIVNFGMTVHKVVKIDGLAYFKNMKNIMDLVILTLTVATFGFYLMRSSQLGEILQTLKDENYKNYAPFARVATVDDSYKYCVAFLNGLVIMKLIMLLKLIKRIGALSRTLQHSAGALASFFVIFIIFIIAFGLSLHKIFVSGIELYSSISNTLWGMLSISLGSFDVEVMLEQSYWMTFFFFPVYMILMNWIMLNILVTIIMDSHYEFKNLETPEDEKILGEMLTAFWGNLNSANKLSTAMQPAGM